MKNFLKVLPLFLFSAGAFAVPVDLTTLMSAVDFSSTITGVLAIGAALIAVYIAWKAARMVIGAVKGG